MRLEFREKMISVVGEMYAGILVDKVRRVTEGLLNDKQGGFRSGTGCVDQIFTLKRIGEKANEKKLKVYVGLIDLEKQYVSAYSEAL